MCIYQNTYRTGEYTHIHSSNTLNNFHEEERKKNELEFTITVTSCVVT